MSPALGALVTALFAALTPACGAAWTPPSETSELELPVWGGTAAGADEWPEVVAADNDCSATLVDAELVVYAAHCGTHVSTVSFGAHVDAPTRVVGTRGCVSHPNAALGNGFDVAYCRLAEPVRDVAVARIAAGSELDAVRVGQKATLVGFGYDRDGGTFGIKRSATVELASLGTDLTVSTTSAGACTGDSGGPLFIDVGLDGSGGAAGEAGGVAEQRLIGVVSASRDAPCGPNVDHYSYLPPLVPWLERSSGRALTPAASGAAPEPAASIARACAVSARPASCGPAGFYLLVLLGLGFRRILRPSKRSPP